jgi:predicted acylesterase/phospholipase RssA
MANPVDAFSNEEKIANPLPILETPFEHIALAFSGGGFRAAAYCLGVLSLLNEATFKDHLNGEKQSNLLQKVTYISSASGGTITNILYALYQVENKPFADFYRDLFNSMNGESILNKALALLNTDSVWKINKYKKRNIINAFSLAYNSDLLYNGKTIADLKVNATTNQNPELNLEEVCFNATEFYRGLPFRQQLKLMPDLCAATEDYFFYGNYVINVNEPATHQLKLADILAASSCFPAGFEPIIFPEDFCQNSQDLAYLKNNLNISRQTGSIEECKFIKEGTFGLMDGGIDDNQGLDSLMQADQRRRKQNEKYKKSGGGNFKPFDLMLINDVGSFYMDPYIQPKTKSKFNASIRSISIIMLLILLAGLACITKVIANPFYRYDKVLIALGSILTFASLLYFAGLGWLYKIIHSTNDKSSLNLAKTFSASVVGILWKDLFGTPIGTILQLLSARFSSILILNNDVFLKRIRKILYDKFYGSTEWKHRGKGNHIYDLAFENNINRATNGNSQYNPSFPMQIIAQVASDMGTTLWFDDVALKDTHSLACIIATGQFTTCYNLLDYIDRLKSNIAVQKQTNELNQGKDEKGKNPFPQLNITNTAYKQRIEEIEALLLAQWNRFQIDPFWLYNQLGEGINGFVESKVSEIPFPQDYANLKPKNE